MFSKLRIGEDDAKAPMVTCGYFNLNHAASTAFKFKIILTKITKTQTANPKPAVQVKY